MPGATASAVIAPRIIASTTRVQPSVQPYPVMMPLWLATPFSVSSTYNNDANAADVVRWYWAQ